MADPARRFPWEIPHSVTTSQLDLPAPARTIRTKEAKCQKALKHQHVRLHGQIPCAGFKGLLPSAHFLDLDFGPEPLVLKLSLYDLSHLQIRPALNGSAVQQNDQFPVQWIGFFSRFEAENAKSPIPGKRRIVIHGQSAGVEKHIVGGCHFQLFQDNASQSGNFGGLLGKNAAHVGNGIDFTGGKGHGSGLSVQDGLEDHFLKRGIALPVVGK